MITKLVLDILEKIEEGVSAIADAVAEKLDEQEEDVPEAHIEVEPEPVNFKTTIELSRQDFDILVSYAVADNVSLDEYITGIVEEHVTNGFVARNPPVR